MSRARMGCSSVVAIVAVAVASGACGGSSSSRSAKPSDSTTSTRPSASSTTAPPLPATAPTSDPNAAKAALRLTDLGAGFANYRKATASSAVGAKSCSVITPGSLLTTRDHAYTGAMFKENGASFFAYSDTYVFRTEALAQQFEAFRATEAFKRCKATQDDASTRAARPGEYVKLADTTYSDPTVHVSTMYRELTGYVSGGKQVDDGFYDRYTIRRGRIIVLLYIDSVLGADAAANRAIAIRVGSLLRSFNAALDSRLAGA